jgi:hypothetical protein
MQFMSALRGLVLLLLLGASSVGSAAEQPQADLVVPPVYGLRSDLGAQPAPQGSGFAAPSSILGERDADARNGVRRSGHERARSPLEVHLGRISAAGRSPGETPPLYGEVGIDIGSVAGLSLVPSYRLVLPDERTEDSEAAAAQVLKLGARIRF